MHGLKMRFLADYNPELAASLPAALLTIVLTATTYGEPRMEPRDSRLRFVSIP